MIFLQSNWIIGFVLAYVFFMMGRYDAQNSSRGNHGPLWALASILITVGVIQLFGGGWLFVLVAQVLLFVAITAFRALVEK